MSHDETVTSKKINYFLGLLITETEASTYKICNPRCSIWSEQAICLTTTARQIPSLVPLLGYNCSCWGPVACNHKEGLNAAAASPIVLDTSADALWGESQETCHSIACGWNRVQKCFSFNVKTQPFANQLHTPRVMWKRATIAFHLCDTIWEKEFLFSMAYICNHNQACHYNSEKLLSYAAVKLAMTHS